ncbi:hypothetical protein BDZ94DRAFT_785543 [Collybia nuda]|uniref:G domain-containing protein n=1 Tax=Collybia nuda TaxID=64659 RepID=A0A9P5YEB4_9AGAR|nr:hypothetical protein BDZ94DRAFT_785543 [Collybia nuda]
MGPTGTGKSSFIATATGDDLNTGIGHDLASCTTEIKMIRYESPHRSDLDLVFVDTPGSDCTELTDAEVLEMIEGWVNETYQRRITLAGIIYFHRISDNRSTVTPLTNFGMFRKLCGKNSLHNIIMATTMWDDVEIGVGAERETELMATDWKAMVDQGSAVLRFDRTEESAWNILDRFVRNANTRHANLLQRDLVDLKRRLPDAKSAQKLFAELEALVDRWQSTLRKIRGPTHRHNAIIMDTLKIEHDGLRMQLATVLNDIQDLEIPLGKHILRLIQGLPYERK